MTLHMNNKQNKERNGYAKLLRRFAFLLVFSILLQSLIIVNVARSEAMSELTVTVINNNQVKLQWTDNYSDELRYIVEKKVDNGSFTQISRYRDSVDYTDSSVNSGHTYTYRIKVVESSNITSIYTDEVTFSTLDVQKPNSLKVSAVSSDQIDLKWSYADNKAFTTIIERREAGDTEWYKLATVPSGQFTYSDKNVVSGITYYYKVRSVFSEKVKSSSFPDEDRGYSSSPLLYKPTDLYGFAKSQYSIQIEWSDSYNAATYVIQRKSPDQSTFKTIAVVPNNVNIYVDINDSASPIKPNTVYTYRIQAISGSSNSEYSDLLNVTSTFLNSPATLAASSVDGTKVNLSWKDYSDGETGFEIWRRAASDAEWTLYDSVGRNATSYTDIGVSPQVSYTYRIRARINDYSVFSDFSNQVNIWVSSISSPLNLDYTILQQNEIELNWQDSSGSETGFKVERKEGELGKWQQIAQLNPNIVKYTDKRLNNTKIYYYRIQVFDAANSTSYSNEVEVSFQIPGKPTELEARNISANEIQLNWKDNSYQEKEFVIEAKQFTSFREIGRVGANTTTFIHKGTLSEGTFTYRVKAVNGIVQSAYSNEAMASGGKKAGYTDLGGVKWAVEAIEGLAGKKVFDAKPGTKFYPEQSITRGEYCAIIVRSLELGDVAAGRYADVTSKHKYYKEIMIAAKLGIVSNDKNNKIYPDRLITREQAGVMLALALKISGRPLPEQDSSILKQFADYQQISEGSAERISAVCGAGIITGRQEKDKVYLRITSNVTRAEAAVMMYKALSL